jgi:hypothetical protein
MLSFKTLISKGTPTLNETITTIKLNLQCRTPQRLSQILHKVHLKFSKNKLYKPHGTRRKILTSESVAILTKEIKTNAIGKRLTSKNHLVLSFARLRSPTLINAAINPTFGPRIMPSMDSKYIPQLRHKPNDMK